MNISRNNKLTVPPMFKHIIRSGLNHLGYEIARQRTEKNDVNIPKSPPYIEREEYGASNLQTKLENVKVGRPFEYPDIVNLNHAVALFIEEEINIVELGSGTGKFAIKASEDKRRRIIASEFDEATYAWCMGHVQRENISFINGAVPKHLAPFDVVVSIEVVEHLSDYSGFLRECASLAPRALLTTPNRKRERKHYHPGPPVYFKHVREWTAGEFYWVLRCFWTDVRLYGLTSQSEPSYIPVDIDTCLSPLIADCRNPMNIT